MSVMYIYSMCLFILNRKQLLTFKISDFEKIGLLFIIPLTGIEVKMYKFEGFLNMLW